MIVSDGTPGGGAAPSAEAALAALHSALDALVAAGGHVARDEVGFGLQTLVVLLLLV